VRPNSPTRFALRMISSAIAAFWLGQVLKVPLHGLWAVLTALIVTQASLGGSTAASLEYVLGTLTGAAYASCMALLIPHTTPRIQDSLGSIIASFDTVVADARHEQAVSFGSTLASVHCREPC
jgi:uncharacterized membrane protein YccC